MDGSTHLAIEEEMSRLKLERTVTPAHAKLTQPVGLMYSDHQRIKKITCMGSGFVGGVSSSITLEAWSSNAMSITCLADRPHLCCYCLQVRRPGHCR